MKMDVAFNRLRYLLFPCFLCWLSLISQEVSSFSSVCNKIASPGLFGFIGEASSNKRSKLLLDTKRYHYHSFRSYTILFFAIERKIGNNENDDDNDNEESSSSSPLNIPMPTKTKYMTALEISHRTKEIELLADLAKTDTPTNDIIVEFRKLWRSERGSSVEEKVLRAWKDMGHPDLWNQAEKTMLDLIYDDPTYLYPFVFLSKLYCLQGKFHQSSQICESILKLKPYHFVVIETMVANSFALQDQEQIQHWEKKRLPQPTQKQQRLEWVKQAIEDATQILLQAKESNVPRTATEGGGAKNDDGYGIVLKQRNDCNDGDDGDGSSRDSWQ